MSQKDVQLIRDGVDAVNRADAEAFVKALHPDVEWEAGGEPFAGFRLLYRGRAEVLEWFEQALGRWEGLRGHVEEITELGDDGYMLSILMTARDKTRSGKTRIRKWQLLWFSDGKLRRRTGPYLSREEAVEAVRLRE